MTDEYMVSNWNDAGARVERWFATRDERTHYLLEQQLPPVLAWEDPARDFNGINIYCKGRDIRSPRKAQREVED